MKKTVVSVHMVCSKCKRKAMKIVSKLEGIDSIEVNVSENTVTVTGETDPVKITKQLKKFKSSAQLLSVGPPKKEEKNEEEKNQNLPPNCERCGTWFIVGEERYHSYCSIM